MADVFKFPHDGYDVIVCKKHDILACIDSNIIDKELALEIVEQCEKDAAEFINQGRWTGIPFIGNIRVPKIVQALKTDVNQAIIQEAKELLDKEQYVLFKKKLTTDNYNHIKHERYYNYIVSMAITRNKKFYKKLCATKGEKYAKIILFALKHVTAIDNEYVIKNYD